MLIAAWAGLLVSWLDIAGLIALTVAWPRNPVPLVLLAAWAVLIAVTHALPGMSARKAREQGPVMLILLAPFTPFARAGIAVWRLPSAVQGFLEGNSGKPRRAGRREQFP
jgi:hypothetical protein